MKSMRVGFLVVTGALALGACGSDQGEQQRVATWYGGVQPLMVQKCGGCHTDGGAGPFPLDSYGEAVESASGALAAIESNLMPPWGAHDTDECAPTRPFKDDLRLSDDDKALLREWVATGTPLGDPATALPVPVAPVLELADATVARSFAQPFTVPSDKHDVFECFVLDPGITEPSWITGVQVTPGNKKVAHHALVFLDNNAESVALATDGHFPCFSNPDINVSLIAAWAPGSVPMTLPAKAGMPIKPGARLVVQMHYHPLAEPTSDQSSVALRVSTRRPDWEALLALLGNFDSFNAQKLTGLMPGPNDGATPEFVIPAGMRNHTETMVFSQTDFPIAVPVFAVGAHMHYVGVDMKIERTFADTAEDDRECLLQTPKWNFNWQRTYEYDVEIDDLPMIRPGDELIMRCTYDNSMQNPFVKDALLERGLAGPIDVRLGEETLDEMCLGVFGVLAPPGLIDNL